MALTEKDFQLIDNAILNQLSETDKLEFDRRMTDPSFAEYYHEQQLIQEVIQEKGHSDMKRHLESIENDIKNKNSKVLPFYRRRGWLIAASLFLLAAVYNIISLSQPDHMNLFKKYYQLYPNLVDPITKGEADDNPSAFQLYEMGRYEEAKLGLEKLPPSEISNWYLIQIQIQSGSFKKAKESLNAFVRNDQSEYQSAAEWYLALVHLKTEEPDESKLILTRIAQNKAHAFNERAVKLLDEL